MRRTEARLAVPSPVPAAGPGFLGRRRRRRRRPPSEAQRRRRRAEAGRPSVSLPSAAVVNHVYEDDCRRYSVFSAPYFIHIFPRSCSLRVDLLRDVGVVSPRFFWDPLLLPDTPH